MKKRIVAVIFVLFLLLSACQSETPAIPEIQEEQIVEQPKEQQGALIEQPNITPEKTSSLEEVLAEVPNGEETSAKLQPCGKFFDAYTRVTGGPQDSGEVKESELASLLAKRMQENNVGCALLVGVDVTDFDTAEEIKESVDYYSTIINAHPGKFAPLLDIDADTASEITLDLIQKILEEAKGKIKYLGFGEVSFVDPGPWKGKKLTDKPLPEVIAFLGKNDLVLAAHLREGQTAELETILSQYPQTRIIVHSNPAGIKELLQKYRNLYYAAELEIMLGGGNFGCSVSVTDGKVESAIREYAPIIAAAPEQVLWATNAHSKCHFQPEFYGKLMEFSAKFLAKLPAEHRNKFANENAIRVFGVPPQ